MLPANLIVNFDGACTKNPGGRATFSFIVKCGLTHKEIYTSTGEVKSLFTSCNVAEWAGITSAIRYLKNAGWKGNLTIHGDSKLVINQLNGEWKCKKETLQPYLKDSRDLLEGMNWSAEWIPRAKNQSADTLSRKRG